MLYGQNPASGDDALDVELRALSRKMQRALINFVTNQDPQREASQIKSTFAR